MNEENLQKQLLKEINAVDEAKIKELVKKGADINAAYPANKLYPCDKTQTYPLVELTGKCSIELIAWLIQHGANVNVQETCDGRSPLHNAPNHETAKLLIRAGADVNAEGGFSLSPFLCTIYDNDLEMFQFMLEHGADVNHSLTCVDENEVRSAPLHAAIHCENITMVKMLIDHGARLDMFDTLSQTPLHTAAEIGNMQIITLLLEHAADVDQLDILPETALFSAILYDNFEVVQLLIERKANVNAKNLMGETPLHLAVRLGDLEMTNFLIESGADLYAKRYDNRTPLMAAKWEAHSPKGISVFNHLKKVYMQDILKKITIPKEWILCVDEGFVTDELRNKIDKQCYNFVCATISNIKEITVIDENALQTIIDAVYREYEALAEYNTYAEDTVKDFFEKEIITKVQQHVFTNLNFGHMWALAQYNYRKKQSQVVDNESFIGAVADRLSCGEEMAQKVIHDVGQALSKLLQNNPKLESVRLGGLGTFYYHAFPGGKCFLQFKTAAQANSFVDGKLEDFTVTIDGNHKLVQKLMLQAHIKYADLATLFTSAVLSNLIKNARQKPTYLPAIGTFYCWQTTETTGINPITEEVVTIPKRNKLGLLPDKFWFHVEFNLPQPAEITPASD
ncbi:MAG: ankyrin repeat domain-containing protein [Epsilonproteobacteria bacterium]|nr:ankyrin repeat domain-containing protein [Campylobacterota bacterium]